MDDELSTGEETPNDESYETNSELNDSEVDDDSGIENTNKGDLRVPLRQTREELRTLKEQLNDQNFIYERAKALGIAQEEDLQPQVSEGYMTPQDVQKQVRDQLEIEKTYEKYPDLRQDEDLRFMVAGLINKGMSPLKAADKTFAKIKEANEKAAIESADEEQKVINTQKSAQSVEATSTKDGEGSEIERLYKKAHDRNDPREQRKAMIELEKLKFRGQK